MAHLMSDVSTAVSKTADKVMDRFRPKRRSMLAERWPLFALAAVLVVGVTAGIAFAIVQRRGMDTTDMNTKLDDMLGGGHAHDPVI